MSLSNMTVSDVIDFVKKLYILHMATTYGYGMMMLIMIYFRMIISRRC